MSASQNNLTLLLNQQDSSGANIINRSVGAVAYSGSVGVFRDGLLPDTAGHSQALPATEVLQFYLKNTHATAKITVTWTPTGGASNVAKAVGPGAVLVFWCTAAGAGISALSYTSDTANATFEDFLGG